MQEYKVNMLKKILWLSAVIPIMTSISLFGATPIKIMPLGDSITVGYDPVENLTPNNWVSYRGPLWTKLSNGEYNIDFVGSELAGSDYKNTIDSSFDLNHQGFNGIKADEIALNINGYLTTNPTDVILLHIGTNDLLQNESIASTVDDVNTTLENIDNYSKDIKVILARIINREEGYYDPDTTIFNNELNTMVQQRISNGDDIILVDMENGADLNYTTDMIEELHPNTTGYEKIADLWYSTLSTILTPTLPIHLWKLDEYPAATTFVDFYSAADGNCTDSGCPIPAPGQINGAQNFDGNDKIDVMDSGTFDWEADANVTIEFWMKSNLTNTAGENQVIIGRKGQLSNANDIWYVGVDWQSGNIAYGLGTKDGNIIFRQGGIKVANDKWNHVVFIVTKDKIKIYVNGQIDVDQDRAYPNTEHIQGTPINIGYINWRLNYEYIGLIDELTVYDTALSEGLIQQHYKNGFKPHLAEVTAVPTPTNDTTPDYTFSSDREGTITYSGSCLSNDIDTMVGDNTISFNPLEDGTYNDCTITVTTADGNASAALSVTEFVVDTTAPDINLTGDTTINLLLGDTYTEEGATCTDNYDTECNVTIGGDTVDTSTVGDYNVTYNAIDTAGNVATQVIRSVIVTADDTVSSSGGGCSYNPNSKNFDMSFLFMMALGLLYPFRRRFIK